MSDLYLTPAEAAQKLGVHVVTIRRWTESGRLRSIRTAGGHRRIPASAVAQMLGQGKSPNGSPEEAAKEVWLDADDQSPDPVSADQTWAQHALVHTRYEVQTHRGERWMQSLDEETRLQSRETGRRLLGLLLQYLVGTTPEEPMWTEVHQLARDYAILVRRNGLSLTAATKATLFFRDVLTQSTAYYPHLHERGPEQQVELMRKLSLFMNEIQLVITGVYEDHTIDQS